MAASPKRRCAICRREIGIDDSIRLFAGPEGLRPDLERRRGGRGVNLCLNPGCLNPARFIKSPPKGLKFKIEPANIARLNKEIIADAAKSLLRVIGIEAASVESVVFEEKAEAVTVDFISCSHDKKRAVAVIERKKALDRSDKVERLFNIIRAFEKEV